MGRLKVGVMVGIGVSASNRCLKVSTSSPFTIATLFGATWEEMGGLDGWLREVRPLPVRSNYIESLFIWKLGVNSTIEILMD